MGNDYNSNIIDPNLDEKDEDRFSFEEYSSSEKKEEMSDDEVSANLGAPRLADDPVVVFIRHGRTPHNKLALFTGWEDPPLAIEGEEDAKWAGRLLKRHGFEFDVVTLVGYIERYKLRGLYWKKWISYAYQ